jgi:hypothetical protein
MGEKIGRGEAQSNMSFAAGGQVGRGEENNLRGCIISFGSKFLLF